MSAKTMVASRLHGIRDIRIERLPRPEPGPGEVLLRVAAVGVCGSDVHYYLEGRIGSQVVTEPIIMGHEFSAWVAELGPGVEGLRVGQLVTVEPGVSCGRCEFCLQGDPNLCPSVRFCGTPPVDGVFAEYAVMPAENCFALPADISAGEGALLEPLGIAMHTVDLGELRAGQTVAVLGAGPIGLLTAAMARAAGAAQVLMTERLPHRCAFALDYGADGVYNPGTSDVVAEVLTATQGRGVDVAFECAGAPDTPQQAAAMTVRGGRLVLCGIPTEDTITLNASTARHRGLTIRLVRRMKHTYPRAIRMLERGMLDLESLATHYYPLGRIGEAFETVANYRDGVLRAIIEFEE